MEIIDFRNDIVGGVGRTTLAAHLIFFAAELGLKVLGASIDERNDLCPWLRPAGIRWVDALSEDLPTDVDLIVIDVGSSAKSAEILRPSLTLIPVDRLPAEECARKTAATVVGNVMRVRNYQGLPLLDEQLAPELRSLDVLAAEILHRVGLLELEHAPYVRRERIPSLAERERQGAARLAAYFERFAATKKAELEKIQPKPWMVEWARDVESALAGNVVGPSQLENHA